MDISTIWPEWKVAEVIGKGSFGTVYRIVREGEYQAALKVIDVPFSQDEIADRYAEGMDTKSIIEMYQTQVELIRNEIEMIESLKSATHVVRIEDYRIVARTDGKIGWRIYIRLELLQSMVEYLRAGYTLSEDETVKLGLDICDALRSCQSLNNIHWDIKPANIFRTEFGDYKLGDFGISWQMDSPCDSIRIGFSSFRAPEILRGQKYDKTVDIYGLGMVLYTYLNRGRKPFYPLPPAIPSFQDRETAESRRMRGEKFPDPADASPALSAIIRKACSYNPRDRYQDAEALYNALDQYRLSKRSFESTVGEGSLQRNLDDTGTLGKVPYKKTYDDQVPVSYGPKGSNNRNTPSKVHNKRKLPVAIGAIIGIALVAGMPSIWNITPTVAAMPTATSTPEPSSVELSADKGTLMADPNPFGPDDDEYETYPAFGSSYERKDISSIYFLDSLDEAPKDSIDISEEQNGSVLTWFEPDANGLYKMYIAGNNGVIAPADSENLFKGYSLLEKIEFQDAFDTSNVTDMSGMFYWCESLTTLDVSGFDTSNVTDMGEMFSGCESLTSLDVNGFNTSDVTDMHGMFEYCESLTTLDVSGFNTSKVTDMQMMFQDCISLTTLDVSGFNTSKVTDMQMMFQDCISLTTLDVSGFDTSNVTDMQAMFAWCQSLTSLDVSGFDTSNVTDMLGMFTCCFSLSTLDVSGFDTSNVTDMLGMFGGCLRLTTLDVSGFNTSKVTNMFGMFEGCGSLTLLDVSGFDTGNVTDMNSMFDGCSSLTLLDVSGFDTRNVADMHGMFNGCGSLTSVDVGWVDTSNVIDMGSMFEGCESLTSVDVSGFDTSNVKYMGGMFSGCKSLTTLDMSGFDTGNVTYMASIFLDCESLTRLDVSGFATGSVTNMGEMFRGCKSLTTLDVSGFDTGNVEKMDFMFDGCSSLTSLDVSVFETSKVTDMRLMFSGCESLTSLDVSGFVTSKVKDMRRMFNGCKSLTTLDVSGFDTSNVTNMYEMFTGCESLTTLDVSGFDTSNVTDMSDMFERCNAVIIGREKFPDA